MSNPRNRPRLVGLLLSYSFHRAVVAGLSFGAAIIGARYLPPEQFSTAMTAAFLVKFLQILNFGATSGYFVSRYAKEGAFAEAQDGTERRYLFFFSFQLIGIGLLLIAVSAIWMPQYLVGAIAFVLIAPCYAVEPFLRYRRNFFFSLSPDLLLSIGLLSLVGMHLLGGATMVAYLLVIAFLTLVLWMLAMRRHVRGTRSKRFGFNEYRQIIALGGPVYLGSALYLIASSMDRLLLPLYGTDEQVSAYFLAHQLSVGAMIFVTSVNFVNTITLGEARQKQAGVDIVMVRAKLRGAALLASTSFAVLALGAWILETALLPETFDGLVNISLALGAGLALFFTANAITPLVGYFRQQMPLNALMGLIILALACNNAQVYWNGSEPFWLAVGTGVALAVYAVVAIWFTFGVLRSQAESPHAHSN